MPLWLQKEIKRAGGRLPLNVGELTALIMRQVYFLVLSHDWRTIAKFEKKKKR